jgi:hypothetical protein
MSKGREKNDKNDRDLLKMSKNISLEKSFTLNPETCDEVSNLIIDYCEKIGAEKKTY